jgi:hypothetical protein
MPTLTRDARRAGGVASLRRLPLPLLGARCCGACARRLALQLQALAPHHALGVRSQHLHLLLHRRHLRRSGGGAAVAAAAVRQRQRRRRRRRVSGSERAAVGARRRRRRLVMAGVGWGGGTVTAETAACALASTRGLVNFNTSSLNLSSLHYTVHATTFGDANTAARAQSALFTGAVCARRHLRWLHAALALLHVGAERQVLVLRFHLSKSACSVYCERSVQSVISTHWVATNCAALQSWSQV